MSRTALRDAVVAELRKLPEGAAAERKALRAAIGCTAADLGGAIDALRWSGKILFDRLELAASQRGAAGPHPAASPLSLSRDGRGEEGLARPTADAPGGEEAQPGQPDWTQEPTGTIGAKRALPPHPTGPELLDEVRAYCASIGCNLFQFSMAAVGFPGLHKNLEISKRPHQVKTVDKVRRFIAANPDGLPSGMPGRAPKAPDVRHYMPAPPPPPVEPSVAEPPHPAASPLSLSTPGRGEEAAPAPSLAAQVQAEAAEAAERRASARIVGGGSGRPLSPVLRPAFEAIQGEAVATPSDLMVAIQRRHPQLMRRAVQVSRRRGITPAAALYSALEAGLSHVERETAHG